MEHDNPLIYVIVVFKDGAALRFPIKPPVQQGWVMRDLGALLAKWGVEFNVEIPAEVEDA